MPGFIPGLELNRQYYETCIKPIVEQDFPGLRYGAALIGYGSDVLGYDTERSQDHEWGPRLLLFLAEDDFPRLTPALDAHLRERLPPEFMGYSTAFSARDQAGVRLMTEAVRGNVSHHIDFWTERMFFETTLGWDGTAPPTPELWLSFPSQRLLEATAGAVFHDELGTLSTARHRLSWYPDGVWRYLLACQWTRIAQEEAFVGRCHEVDDALGERLTTARLVRDILRLAFLLERRYAPYSKWLGTAFDRLPVAATMGPDLIRAIADPVWEERQAALHRACAEAVKRFNQLSLVPEMPTQVSWFYDRPYWVIHADRIADALIASLGSDPAASLYRQRGLVGSVDQLSDNTDFLADSRLTRAFGALFEE